MLSASCRKGLSLRDMSLSLELIFVITSISCIQICALGFLFTTLQPVADLPGEKFRKFAEVAFCHLGKAHKLQFLLVLELRPGHCYCILTCCLITWRGHQQKYLPFCTCNFIGDSCYHFVSFFLDLLVLFPSVICMKSLFEGRNSLHNN